MRTSDGVTNMGVNRITEKSASTGEMLSGTLGSLLAANTRDDGLAHIGKPERRTCSAIQYGNRTRDGNCNLLAGATFSQKENHPGESRAVRPRVM